LHGFVAWPSRNGWLRPWVWLSKKAPNYYIRTHTVKINIVSVCHSLSTIDMNCEHNLEHFRWNSWALQHSIMGRKKSIIGWYLPMVPWSAFPGVCFSNLSDVLEWLGQVVFKWQWCEWTSTHLSGNHHMTGQKAWPSNWLLFVISRAQTGLRWDHLAVSIYARGKTCCTMSSLHPYKIIFDSGVKTI